MTHSFAKKTLGSTRIGSAMRCNCQLYAHLSLQRLSYATLTLSLMLQ